MEIEISNIADPDGLLKKAEQINVDFNNTELSISNIQLLSKVEASTDQSPMVKNGYFMEPLPFSYYNMAFNQLTFYLEIYNSEQTFQNDYVLAYQIFKNENGQRNLIKKKFKRRSPKSTDALVLNLDLSDINSGNYDLEIALQDKTKVVKLKKIIPFRRSNPVLDTQVKAKQDNFDINKTFVADLTTEELRYSLRAIAPRIHSEDVEALNILVRNRDEKYQRVFLHNFWFVQDQENPEKTYNEYMEVARAVDNMFKNGFGPGFESDRGYFFLKYGRPDDKVEVLNEMATFPFEIWIYDRIEYLSQTNVRFIFYNTTLVPNGHRLLHSTAVGELSNPQFKTSLFRTSANPDQSALDMVEQFFPEF
jgi:GWxTD domain-containing protein